MDAIRASHAAPALPNNLPTWREGDVDWSTKFSRRYLPRRAVRWFASLALTSFAVGFVGALILVGASYGRFWLTVVGVL